MPLRSSLLLLLLGCTACVFAAKTLPPKWKTCKRSDPKLNQCLQKAIEEAVYSLKDGEPSLGVFPVDPLHLQHLMLGDSGGDSRRPVSIKLDFYEMDMYGISSLKMGPVKADWEKGLLEAEVKFTKPFQLIGNYTIRGKVLVLPIVGDGPCKLVFDNFGVKLSTTLKKYTKKKETYLESTKFTVDVLTTRLHYHFENLFNGDKRLGDQMNLFMNENWEEILKELKPTISKNFGEAFRLITNRIFSKVPYDKIAPP